MPTTPAYVAIATARSGEVLDLLGIEDGAQASEIVAVIAPLWAERFGDLMHVISVTPTAAVPEAAERYA
jgi:hypothetical protein